LVNKRLAAASVDVRLSEPIDGGIAAMSERVGEDDRSHYIHADQVAILCLSRRGPGKASDLPSNG
jgi:hypothetical protein